MATKQLGIRPVATRWQDQQTPVKSLKDGIEILETTHRPFTCTYCRKHPFGHPSRLWEVRTVSGGVLRARVPECLLLMVHRRRKQTRKMTDPEKAILSELYRLGVISAQECPK